MKAIPVKTLDDLVESGIVQLTRGKVISKKDMAAHPGTFPVYSSAKDNDGKFGEYGLFMFDEDLITWSVDGGGRLFYRPRHKFSVTNVGGVLRILDRSVLDYKYLYYALSLRHSEIKFDWVKKAHPSVIKKLYQNIPIPSLAEQRRIAMSLDEAFESIAIAKGNAERNLQNVDALFQSNLHTIFAQRGGGWVEKPLSDLCGIKHGFAFKSEYFKPEGEYVLLTPGNFFESGGYRDRGKKQKYYTGEILRDYILHKDDLLVVMTEQAAGLLGSPLLVPEWDKFLHNQRLGLVAKKPDAPWVNEFFFHVFNTEAVRKEIHDTATGIKVRHTSPTKIGNVVVSYPNSVSEQRAIVSSLKDIRRETTCLTAVYRGKLTALEELKKAVLQKAFAGESKMDVTSAPREVAVPSPYIRNQVHAAIIDQVAKDGGWTTEVAVAKYDHLLQEVYGLSLAYEFEKQQFGPFDAQIKRLVSSGLGRNRWFAKRNGMLVFGTNADALLSRQSNLYRAAQSKMRELARLGVTKLDADRVELLSTVCHSIKETGSTKLDAIRDFMAGWPTDGNRTKAEKFTVEQTRKCLDFIIINNLHQKLSQPV